VVKFILRQLVQNTFTKNFIKHQIWTDCWKHKDCRMKVFVAVIMLLVVALFFFVDEGSSEFMGIWKACEKTNFGVGYRRKWWSSWTLEPTNGYQMYPLEHSKMQMAKTMMGSNCPPIVKVINLLKHPPLNKGSLIEPKIWGASLWLSYIWLWSTTCLSYPD